MSPFDESETLPPKNPSFDCVRSKHLWINVMEGALVRGSWCPWCGTGAYDPDKISDDGEAIGFAPEFQVNMPDGFRR